MTTKQIDKALHDNRRVVLRDDVWKWIRRDLFGDLVVVDVRHSDEPVRKATLSDKRNAMIMGTTTPRKKQTL